MLLQRIFYRCCEWESQSHFPYAEMQRLLFLPCTHLLFLPCNFNLIWFWLDSIPRAHTLDCPSNHPSILYTYPPISPCISLPTDPPLSRDQGERGEEVCEVNRVPVEMSPQGYGSSPACSSSIASPRPSLCSPCLWPSLHSMSSFLLDLGEIPSSAHVHLHPFHWTCLMHRVVSGISAP